MSSRLVSLCLAGVALVSLAACAGGSTPSPSESAGISPPTGQAFSGEVRTGTITIGDEEVTVPEGISLPSDSSVSDATDSYLMLTGADPQPVVTAVKNSAEASGYTTYAEPDAYTTVFVGNGNAVQLRAMPDAQLLTWGPEAMKDVLSEPAG